MHIGVLCFRMEARDTLQVVDDHFAGPGCVVRFGSDVSMFLAPEKEAELLALLMARAPKLQLREPREEEGLRRFTAADFPLDQLEIGLGSPHGDPAGSNDLAIPAEPVADVVIFPDRGANFRTVGSFGAGKPETVA